MKTRIWLAGAALGLGALAAGGAMLLETRVEAGLRASLIREVRQAFPDASVTVGDVRYALLSNSVALRDVAIETKPGDPASMGLRLAAANGTSPLLGLTPFLLGDRTFAPGVGRVRVVNDLEITDVTFARSAPKTGGEADKVTFGRFQITGLTLDSDLARAAADAAKTDRNKAAALATLAVAFERATVEAAALRSGEATGEVASMAIGGFAGGRMAAMDVAGVKLLSFQAQPPRSVSVGGVDLRDLDLSALLAAIAADAASPVAATPEPLAAAAQKAKVARLAISRLRIEGSGQVAGQSFALDSLALTNGYDAQGRQDKSAVTMKGFDASFLIPANGEAREGLRTLGYDRVVIDVESASRLDHDAREMTIDAMTFAMRDAGSLTIAMTLANLDLDKLKTLGADPTQVQAIAAVILNATVKRTALAYDDDSLFGRVIAALAQVGGQSADAIQAGLALRAATLPVAFGPGLQSLADALAQFARNPKRLSVELVATDPGGLPFSALAQSPLLLLNPVRPAITITATANP